MRRFYLTWRIPQTASAKSDSQAIPQTVSAKLAEAIFPLSWSHYVHLMSVKKGDARRFYETEALQGGWTVRQLQR